MREISLGDSTTVSELANVLHVDRRCHRDGRIQGVGLMTTIHELLSFEQPRTIPSGFGYVARRSGGPEGA